MENQFTIGQCFKVNIPESEAVYYMQVISETRCVCVYEHSVVSYSLTLFKDDVLEEIGIADYFKQYYKTLTNGIPLIA